LTFHFNEIRSEDGRHKWRPGCVRCLFVSRVVYSSFGFFPFWLFPSVLIGRSSSLLFSSRINFPFVSGARLRVILRPFSRRRCSHPRSLAPPTVFLSQLSSFSLTDSVIVSAAHYSSWGGCRGLRAESAFFFSYPSKPLLTFSARHVLSPFAKVSFFLPVLIFGARTGEENLFNRKPASSA